MRFGVNMYDKGYHACVHKNLLMNKNYYLFRARYADKFYWKYLKGKVLEFGCGLGQNVFLHRENSVGVDVSEFALSECKKRGISVVKDIKKIKDKSFDGVLCCHALEHLKDPYHVVSEFYRILKDNGNLVVVLPYSKNNRPIKNFRSDIAKHFFSWDFGSINELLYDVGFKIDLNKFNYAYGFSKFYNFPFHPAVRLLNLLGRMKNKKEMIIVSEKN